MDTMTLTKEQMELKAMVPTVQSGNARVRELTPAQRRAVMFAQQQVLKAQAAKKAKEEPAQPETEPVTFKENIDFDAFEKVDMTVVKVLECEKVKKSKKLLRFTLDDGSGTPRQILSGIAAYYQPEELVGKTLVACTNLAPRKMMGLESCGMLLSAEKDDKLNLLMLDDAIPAGAKLC